MRQWHPLFAELLRPLLEKHYDVLTNIPVGDVPREADLLLLRRTSTGTPPFHGLWRWLTPWNILEFKGPTGSARVGDLDLLLELGLGIDRRLHEERRKQRQPAVQRGDVSFWYLANHLGRRFLRDARGLLGELQELEPGVWRVKHLGRSLVLVSNRQVAVERDSVPVHLLVEEPVEATRQTVERVAAEAELCKLYGGWAAILFPTLWEEVERMARKKGHGPVVDFEPAIERLGLMTVLGQAGLRRVIDEVGVKRVIDEVGVKQVIDEVGMQRVIGEVGVKRVIDEVGMDRLLTELSAKQRRELLRRLQEEVDS